MKKILLGLTTTPGSDWRSKIKETDEFNISEVALFATFLNFEERKELYQLIEASKINSIPHVHIRDDFKVEEIEFFYNKFNTRLFNLHSDIRGEEVLKNFSKYKDLFYVENQIDLDDRFYRMVKNCGGICLDVSHYVQYWKINKQKNYESFEEFLNENRVGCCHISAVHKQPKKDKTDNNNYSNALHFLHDLADVDYVKDYLKYLPNIISIELENSFKEQIKIREHLKSLISTDF